MTWTSRTQQADGLTTSPAITDKQLRADKLKGLILRIRLTYNRRHKPAILQQAIATSYMHTLKQNAVHEKKHILN